MIVFYVDLPAAVVLTAAGFIVAYGIATWKSPKQRN